MVEKKRQRITKEERRSAAPGSDPSADAAKKEPPVADTRVRRMPLENPDFEAEIAAWRTVETDDAARREQVERRSRALELVAEGWNADSDDAARERAHLATREHDLCSDAWLLIARRVMTRPDQRLGVLETALRCAEALVGPDFEERYRGRFWKQVESRPYVRARSALGLFLWEVGFRKRALRHVEEMLKLEPGDPLGLRFHLLGWHLAEGCPGQARGLLRRYARDTSAAFRWGAVLERLQAGDEPGARNLCERALERDAQGARMIANATPPPAQPPAWRAPGSPEDALLGAQVLRPAWRSTPNALAWLRAALTPGPEGELRQTA